MALAGRGGIRLNEVSCDAFYPSCCWRCLPCPLPCRCLQRARWRMRGCRRVAGRAGGTVAACGCIGRAMRRACGGHGRLARMRLRGSCRCMSIGWGLRQCVRTVWRWWRRPRVWRGRSACGGWRGSGRGTSAVHRQVPCCSNLPFLRVTMRVSPCVRFEVPLSMGHSAQAGVRMAHSPPRSRVACTLQA